MATMSMINVIFYIIFTFVSYQSKKRPIQNVEYLKLDRDKSTFKSHRDFDSEIEMTFKQF